MRKYWSDIVAALDPYVPGEQPRDQQYIKLNTNENPYPPSPAVESVLKTFDSGQLRRYPDPDSGALIAKLAAYHGVNRQQVFVGNGSDEVLAHAFQALLKQPQPILFPDISYSFYPVYCALYQIEYRQVALDAGFRIHVDDYAAPNGGIVIPNPNAPTGIALGSAEIRQMLQNNSQAAVIIDEAYVDYGAESALALLTEFPNLLVVRTFSKSRGLAGLRLGYALGQESLIEALQRVKNSFNSYPIDSLTSALGIAALEDEDYFQQCRARVIASRERLRDEMQRLGFNVFPSSSNFVFVRHPDVDAESLYRDLKADGILVRYFEKARIDQCLRITIGTEDDCATLLAALRKIL